MATIDVQPIYLKDVLLTVASDEYSKHVSSVALTPSTSSATWKGLAPDAVYSNIGTAT